MTDAKQIFKDAAYVTVGLGVIAFQKAQVQRQEIQKQLQAQLDDTKGGFTRLADTVEDRVKVLEERLESLSEQLDGVFDNVEEQVDKVLDDVQERLPEQARDLFQQARETAKQTQTQLRSLVRSTGNGAAA